jgi:hypothetical protein
VKTKLKKYRIAIIILAVFLVLLCGLLWRFLIGPSWMLDATEHDDVQKIALYARLGISPDSDLFFIGGFMHCAAAGGKVPAMAKLLELGANVNRLDEYGATPAHAAAFGDQAAALRWLLAHGADPSIKDRDGYNVAEYIINHLDESQRPGMIAILEEASNQHGGTNANQASGSQTK